MKIRPFKENDIEEVLELCNRHMEFDTLSEGLLREKLFSDPDYEKDLILTAWENDRLTGFLAGVIRDSKPEKTGYIKLMVVHGQFRRRKTGFKLYKQLEGIYKNQNVKKVRVYDVPFNYFMPGIDPRYTAGLAFFETLNFHRFADTANMIVDLTNQDFGTYAEEKQLAAEGIEINRANYNNREDLFRFIDKNFPSWHYEVSNAFNSSPVSLHIARYHGEIKAFSAHNGNNMGTGWFGPMGAHAELRGKGTGSILLKRCMQDIKDWGLHRSVIPWVGPIRFYSRCVNAVVERVFWRYEKQLL